MKYFFHKYANIEIKRLNTAIDCLKAIDCNIRFGNREDLTNKEQEELLDCVSNMIADIRKALSRIELVNWFKVNRLYCGDCSYCGDSDTCLRKKKRGR